MSAPKFASVVLDVDSTLAGVEGIDWLAAQRGPDMAKRIAELTDMAMRGEISLDEIYGRRLSMIRPTHREIGALSKRYVEAMAPGAREAVGRLRDAGVAIAVVSGGIREAIVPLALSIGVHGSALRAVSVYFEEHGEYTGFEKDSPLATQRGKAEVVRALALPAPVLAVGDGATDLAMRPAVNAFAAYTGFVRREPVVRDADFVLESFAQLEQVVLA
ncbi:MAG TPA: HAD-IB family phosphatase [Gemmatimonadaceae bacterium]